MTKQEFMVELSRLLGQIPREERQDILRDYEDHFAAGLEAGQTEAEIAQALGSPDTIARNFTADYAVKTAEENRSAGNILRAVVAIISLGFFNLVFVLGPFLGLLGVLFALVVAGFVMVAVGVSLVLAGVFSPVLPITLGISAHPLVAALTGTGLASLGLLVLIGDFYLAKVFYGLTIQYLKLNLRIIQR
jgi:uncharacterized membrane protein